MQVFDSANSKIFRSTAVALGNFDGLHLGHMALVSALSAKAAENGLASLAYTFGEHPQNVLSAGRRVSLLMNNEQKCDILRGTAIDGVYFERFDLDYARIEPEEFARRVLVGKLRARLVAAGFNYRFGRENHGTAESLEEYGAKHGFGVLIVKPYRVGGQCASSSLIREMVAAGDVQGAARFLGRLFSVRGVVREGFRIGRTIGVPTANIGYGADVLAPGQGVYATACKVGGRLYRGLTSIGKNPTAGPRDGIAMETFLFGFRGDIYGAEAEVYFYKKIRDIHKFSDMGALKSQIERDIGTADGYFSG
ncbi:MAG: bifunctional riboflavin kinase/FAD synthetase [Clostridiales bacterium]|jgi:riboflavin kinase/FMN adenylyltransferase|nr:bifunctional riboflavin kinase/FAD synthetase [Clostridiales bacterium]